MRVFIKKIGRRQLRKIRAKTKSLVERIEHSSTASGSKKQVGVTYLGGDPIIEAIRKNQELNQSSRQAGTYFSHYHVAYCKNNKLHGTIYEAERGKGFNIEDFKRKVSEADNGHSSYYEVICWQGLSGNEYNHQP